MSTEPTPIGPEIEFVLRRTVLLKDHADAVLEVRDCAARARLEMIAREVRIIVMDGLSPRLAEVAAKNNLAVRLHDLDDEVAAELERLQEQLRRRLRLLMEELEDQGA
jgi:isopropylmalate/homocitrate/citramalate synthase